MAAHHNSDIIGRLTEKRRKQHEDAVRDFNSELTRISEVTSQRPVPLDHGTATARQEFGLEFVFLPLADVRGPGERLQPGDAVVPAGSGPATEEPEGQDGGRERRQSAGADEEEREDLHPPQEPSGVDVTLRDHGDL